MESSYQSDVGKIQRILVKHAKDAFVSEEFIGSQWRGLYYQSPPDFAQALDEYDAFVDLLSGFNIEIHFLSKDQNTGLDSIYPRDASIVCEKGIILCSMGKAARKAEPASQEKDFQKLDLAICGTISGDGKIEGGDVAWIDHKTLAVGRGYRTNDEGIRQLREFLGDCIEELMVVPLPHWRGSTDVFHLMSMLSPIDYDKLLVYSPLLPVQFRESLLDRGMKLIEVPDSEFETMGCNVLTIAPGKCIMVTGNPQTRKRLEGSGVEVYEFKGQEICVKGAGGPTCLTRPLTREISA